MAKKGEFEVQFIRMRNPKTQQEMGVVGIDNGDHVYVPAKLHPSALDNNDAGRAAFIQCHKASTPVAAFENAFYVEANWLRAELKTPYSKTSGTRTLTHTMLDKTVELMVEAAQAFRGQRKNGTFAGKADDSGDAVLLEVPVAESSHE